MRDATDGPISEIIEILSDHINLLFTTPGVRLQGRVYSEDGKRGTRLVVGSFILWWSKTGGARVVFGDDFGAATRGGATHMAMVVVQRELVLRAVVRRFGVHNCGAQIRKRIFFRWTFGDISDDGASFTRCAAPYKRCEQLASRTPDGAMATFYGCY